MPALPRVMAVAVVLPRLKVPAAATSRVGVRKLVFALPVPLMRKLAVWSALFWFWMKVVPVAPSYCHDAAPLVLLQIKVALAPFGIGIPATVTDVVPILLT